MKIKTAILLSLALLSCSGVAAQNTIYWGVHDLPPLQITTGKYAHQGIYDGVLDFLQSKMPEYKHKKREANAKRFWKWLKSKDQFCYVASIPTPYRKKLAYFSIANGFHVANSIIMTKSTAHSMGLGDKVSLKTLMLNQQLEGGVVAARAYGRQIDKMLQELKHPKFQSYVSANLGQSVYQMLLSNRMDYIIEYPFVIEYFDQLLKTPEQSTSLMIKEINPFTMGHSACPQNEWGRKVISKINKILIEHRGTPAYRALMERWQSKTVKKHIRDNYHLFLESKAVD